MCYHTSITQDQKIIEERFKASFYDIGAYQKQYHNNGFGNQYQYIITQTDSHVLEPANWGLLPVGFWQKDSFIKKFNTLNAKAETIFTKAMYKEPILQRRCLIVSDGFFESKNVNSKKIPHYIHINKQLFTFAGVFNFHDDGVLSCSIITTEANDFMANIHNEKKRMPFILDPTFESSWLDSNLTKDNIQEILNVGFIQEPLEAYTVSKEINNSRVESNYKEILKEVYYPDMNTLF